MDSVNEVCWIPYTNTMCTASSDKTVSLWDARSGLCTQTLYGHQNSCNHATSDLKGELVASTGMTGFRAWNLSAVALHAELWGVNAQIPTAS